MADTTIFTALREDHEIQRDLIDRLTATSGDTDERTKLYGELKDAMEAHAAAEERYFYRKLMEHDLTMEQARHSVSEHKELDDFLEELDDTDQSSPGWLATAKKLCDRLLHHLDEEETEIFPVAGKALGDDQKEELAEQYRDEMRRLQG